MPNGLILQDNVIWSYDHEIGELSIAQKVMSGLSGMGGPPHHHTELIALTDQEILIESRDGEDLQIPLSSLTEIYLGFDDVYNRYWVKNAGLFWQPLRLRFTQDDQLIVTLYLIIDYTLFHSHNQKWYDELTAVLQ